jgi:hypothetical protein
MVKLKLFIAEYWVLISWFVTVLIDTQYHILEDLGLNNGLISLVRIGGSALLAYFTKDNLKSKYKINI